MARILTVVCALTVAFIGFAQWSSINVAGSSFEYIIVADALLATLVGAIGLIMGVGKFSSVSGRFGVPYALLKLLVLGKVALSGAIVLRLLLLSACSDLKDVDGASVLAGLLAGGFASSIGTIYGLYDFRSELSAGTERDLERSQLVK